MQRVYLVDYENVDTNGLDGLSGLTSNDKVFIFYSERHSRMTFGLHRRIMASVADINYIKIQDKSKNALDNRLIQKLQELVRDNSKANYYVISKDSDYDKTIKKLRNEHYKIDKQDCIKVTKENDINHIEKLIRERIREDKNNPFNMSDEQIRTMARAISQSNTKTELNVELQKIFYNKDVKYIFSRIRDLTNYD